MIDPITFEQLKELITLALIAIGALLLYKSVPAHVALELRAKAGEVADKTPTPIDNILLQIYDYLRVLIPAKSETPATPVVTITGADGTTTITNEPLYNPSEADRS